LARIRVREAIDSSVVRTPAAPLASVSAPRDKVPAAIGMVQSAQLLSVAVGPAIGGYVA
jgi:predicted MFS family arabinose efflux permease